MAINEELVQSILPPEEAKYYLALARSPIPSDLDRFGKKIDEKVSDSDNRPNSQKNRYLGRKLSDDEYFMSPVMMKRANFARQCSKGSIFSGNSALTVNKYFSGTHSRELQTSSFRKSPK